MKLHDKMSCILEESRIQMDPAILTVCTIPYNMKADQHAMEMNTKVRNLNEIIKQIHQRSVLPVGLLDVTKQMERSVFPDDASSDGIQFDRPRGVEWLNDVFQRHISALEAELLETAQFTFGPPPNPPFFNSRTLSSRLGATADSRDSSRSSRTRLPGAAPIEAEQETSSTPQSSVVSSVVGVESKRVERPAGTSRSRYLEKVKELDLEDLECRQELAEALGLERVSHEDLSRHQCVDWLKAHETHFSRARIMETADLMGIPTKSVMGPINYLPLKLLGSPGLIVEPPKHRTSIATIRLAIPAQLRVETNYWTQERWNCQMPLMRELGWRTTLDTGNPAGTPNWPRPWQPTKERMITGSRPDSRMELDEAPRSKGRFNLDRAAQEHMNEELEACIPTESTSSLRGLETQPIRPLMDVALPGYTPSSTPSSSQVSGSSSRLKELNERLQLRNRESPARVEPPLTWREQPIRSVVISSYNKITEGRYHRHNRMDWSTAQRVRRDCFHDAFWVEYFTQPRVETARGAAGPDYQLPHQWRPSRKRHQHLRVR